MTILINNKRDVVDKNYKDFPNYFAIIKVEQTYVAQLRNKTKDTLLACLFN